MTGQRVYVHPNEIGSPKAFYIRLPESIQENAIDGKCNCQYCKDKGPDHVAKWDTLCIPVDGKPTWTVHCPELETKFPLLETALELSQ